MKDFSCCLRLVNQVINERISLSAGEHNIMLVKHGPSSDESTIHLIPSYCCTFFHIGEFLKIAEACGCAYSVSCEHNGYCMAPCLYIF